MSGGPFQPQFDWEQTKTQDADGNVTTQTKVHTDPEDWIAASAFIVAIIFAVGMVSHWIPINDSTLGILACTGAGGAIAKIVKARRGKHAGGER